MDVNTKFLYETINGENDPSALAGKTLKCDRFFCKKCLKEQYDVNYKELDKNWICPFCAVFFGKAHFVGNMLLFKML